MKKVKRILALSLSAALLLALLCACGDSGAQNSSDPTGSPTPTQTMQPTSEPTPSPADLAAFYEALAEAYHFPAMDRHNPADEFGAAVLDNFYPGLTDVPAEQLVVCTPMITSVVSEIVLVQVTNAGDVDKVKGILQARIDAQASGGAWYPDTVDGWKNDSRVVSNGNYVLMIANKYCDTIVSDFNAVIADPSFKPVPVPEEDDSEGDDSDPGSSGTTPGFGGGIVIPGFGGDTGSGGDDSGSSGVGGSGVGVQIPIG